MANIDQRFEEFRCDFIAHLAARFGLAPEVVTERLGAWLRERGSHEVDWLSEINSVRSLRTRH
jgi:hypothetical protein